MSLANAHCTVLVDSAERKAMKYVQLKNAMALQVKEEIG
jgi:hypothetical protein